MAYEDINRSELMIPTSDGIRKTYVETSADQVVMGNGRSVESALNDMYVNVKDFGAKGDGVTDDTVAIQSAMNVAKQSNTTVLIPSGVFKVEGNLKLWSSMFCVGEFVTNIESTGYMLEVVQEQNDISLNNDLSLIEGQTVIDTLKEFAPSVKTGDTLHFATNEVLMKRAPAGTPSYYKNDSFTVESADDNRIFPAIAHSINNLRTVVISFVHRPKKSRIYIEGMTVKIKGLNGSRNIVNINRDYVSVKSLNIINTTQTPVKISTAINGSHVDVFDIRVDKTNFDGYGYGIMTGNCHGLVVEKASLVDCRHGVSGRHTKDVVVRDSYLSDVDNHYGYRMLIDNCKFKKQVAWAGYSLKVTNCAFYGAPFMVSIRSDTPDAYGDITIENCELFEDRDSVWGDPGIFYMTYTAGFDYGRIPRTPQVNIKNCRVTVLSDKTNVNITNFGSNNMMSTYGSNPLVMNIENIISNTNRLTIRCLNAMDGRTPGSKLTVRNLHPQELRIIAIGASNQVADDGNKGTKILIENCSNLTLSVSGAGVTGLSKIRNCEIKEMLRYASYPNNQDKPVKFSIENSVLLDGFVYGVNMRCNFLNCVIQGTPVLQPLGSYSSISSMLGYTSGNVSENPISSDFQMLTETTKNWYS